MYPGSRSPASACPGPPRAPSAPQPAASQTRTPRPARAGVSATRQRRRWVALRRPCRPRSAAHHIVGVCAREVERLAVALGAVARLHDEARAGALHKVLDKRAIAACAGAGAVSAREGRGAAQIRPGHVARRALMLDISTEADLSAAARGRSRLTALHACPLRTVSACACCRCARYLQPSNAHALLNPAAGAARVHDLLRRPAATASIWQLRHAAPHLKRCAVSLGQARARFAVRVRATAGRSKGGTRD